MYYNEFSVSILSKSSVISDVLSSVTPPEDSGFKLKAISKIDVPVISLDSAVIIDKNMLSEDYIPDDIGYTALIICADEISKTDKSLLCAADTLWVMPSGDNFNAQLLKIYFNTMLKTLKEKADFRKQRICLTTAIDSIPDLIWYKDCIGAHLMVNNGFCKAVEKTKQQIYKKGHYYIWDIPKTEYDQGDYVCLESEEVVMNARKTCLFDEKVKTKGGMRQFKTYKSPLIDENGEIFGTCGIAHDVTDLQNINNELEVVLESMPFAVAVEDRSGTILSVNSQFLNYFSENKSVIGTNFASWKANALPDKRFGSEEEYTIKPNHTKEIIIVHGEAPVLDIFKEQIGKVHIFRDVTAERSNELINLQRANTDFMTGLHNRRSLFAYLEKAEKKPQLSFITLDLDNFKMVNDKFGHAMGDNAIIDTANMLKEYFHDDFIARLGGDEFLVVIERSCSGEELEATLQDFIDRLMRLYSEHEPYKVLSVSAGIAYSVLSESVLRHNVELLLKRSDKAMYLAKNNGKGRFYTYI